MSIIPIISAGWALIVLALLIWAIRISYRIERMTGYAANWPLPRYTNLFASAFGSGGNALVMANRRKLRRILAAIASLFIVMAIVLPMLLRGT